MAPKRTRRKKQGEGLPVPAEETAPPGNKDDETEVRRGSSAGASSSSNITAAGTTKQKRASRGTSKKAAKGVTASSDEEQAKGEERVTIQRLPYEDFLVLPRQAEHVLIALGLRSPQETSSPAGVNEVGSPSAPATPLAAGRSGSIGTILELASYLGRSDPKELATPLLIAQYQGYLGPSPDYLYDLFCLDYEPPYLSSGAVKDAAVAAARSISHASSLLSAKGTPPETLARAAMDCLQAHVGMEVVAAQEVQAPRLAEAQLELFLLDWASARLAGLKGELGIPYLARRCAALQLTRPIVLERLYRYTVQGDSLQDLASAGGRTVRLSQPMDALLEGLKAGVRIDPERLLNDFRLSSLGAPLREHLQEVWRAVVQEAARSLEPGSAMYYTALVEKLHVNLGIRAALKQQEAEWQQEQGERDGSTLTYAQLRLLFHLWRLERFRAEEQARRRRQAAAATPGGTP
ncbi:hypothetical protein VOLCADRAFT_88296 [Volvox carteri f. nagariensis]|uniref:Uncharacterized protein n=1 Tax=Volvox carteri f. nagariensis TaxID=3068 RepID=D8TNT9_VOLCA|nr:uncharacterized protein VOLCADRAFT_88296 [Volvox carteri f. nagariensis]EFJ50899.1 hypothetical protein VOLCADRAFT_88296 [Volvox carteri f. nagariensis]|eukprot:XP_002947911.1 hypothetical protein VOLCADRAFT_88296 [Volvox carteri f. nagariensis]